ncbi:MAG: hypothetical protein V1655_00210 [bacterium]
MQIKELLNQGKEIWEGEKLPVNKIIVRLWTSHYDSALHKL